MRPTDLARTSLAFVILVLLHYTLRPVLGWHASPDFLLIALLLVAIRIRPGTRRWWASSWGWWPTRSSRTPSAPVR